MAILKNLYFKDGVIFANSYERINFSMIKQK